MTMYAIFIWKFRKNISLNNFDGKNIILFYIAYTIFEYIRGCLNIDSLRDYIYI